jgi:ABC-type Mn2+/Zn2+ transport system permease subunit
MFEDAFMQRALLAALLLGPVCALLGVFVTARRMAFFSDTIAHGALTGVALGIWLGFADLTLPMVLFSLVIAAGILYLKEKTDLLTDTIMALLLSGSVALGILILSLTHGSRGEIHGYLFGDILAVGGRDVWFAAALFVIVMIGLFTWLSPLALLTANEDLAHVSGVPIRRANYLFILILTVAVALSIRLLGIILVTSLIVVPPATARNISRNLRQQLITSVLIGVVGALSGTVLAYRLDVPCGPAIVLSCVALFILSLAFKAIRVRRLA